MVQTTPLFNALRQESYQAAKPRLLYRAQYRELANTLIETAYITPDYVTPARVTPASASASTTHTPVAMGAATTSAITLLVTDKDLAEMPFAERHGRTFQLAKGVILDPREMLTLYYSPGLY